jgi:signal transduction histidine kinase
MASTAEHQKILIAEKQVSYARTIVILFGTLSFFFLDPGHIIKPLAYILLALIWLYGAFILTVRPYEKYPIFLAAWFTYVSDSIFATAWIYATGGYYSPFHVMLYTSIIAVAFRFDLKTTMFTATLYVVCYIGLLFVLNQLDGNTGVVMARLGFIYIIGFMTNLITSETLAQTAARLEMEQLAEEARKAQEELQESRQGLSELNEKLQLQNSIFLHSEENALIGSYAWNLKSNKLQYSDNLFRLLGHEPGDFEPSFEKYLTFIHPDDRDKMLQEGERVFSENKINPAVQRVISRDGKLKYLRATGKIFGEGAELTMIGTLQDISDDVLLQEKLQQKNLELQQTNQQLESFNYIASHDLQEPVRKIHTFSDLILQKESKGLSPTAVKYLERITFSTARMQALIQAFLDYSRIGNRQLHVTETDLNELMEEVKGHLQETLQKKNAVVEYSSLPVMKVEPLQFQQLFVNLIGNAAKYSREGVPPVIKISAEIVSGRDLGSVVTDPRRKYHVIRVEDNGIGFEPKYSEKIFEVFQRLHQKDQFGGSGIGLAICKKVVQAHHGTISASSTPGVGSVFTIIIPAERLHPV